MRKLLEAIDLIKETCKEYKGYCSDCPMYDHVHNYCEMRTEPWTWDYALVMENLEGEPDGSDND